MNPFVSVLLRISITIPSTALMWIISFFGFDLAFWMSTVISLAGGAVVYQTVKGVSKHRFIKSQGLTRKEFKYIERNLKDAKLKINRLNKALFAVRSIPQLKHNIEVLRITRKIYRITKKEPRRFYLGEKFFYSHLDSFVEMAEKYSFLSSQPSKNRELNQSLVETRRTMEELTLTLERDLHQILSNDIDQLNFEVDVAKRSIKTIKDSQNFDEGGNLK
ncbi:5-bromo-4-chloroindolyl phosphate hydrolysis family protein [Bacillus dakarensis]|uniref:5-bromo-4-chloroindolyl phosphate hydrolysis family protein n=1 Tax=Robertmurraya dakarensis TaxID=1926278 RepID=UPI00098165E0|nr:5-bromo-4-chloroindolyl phosphate hydrolysis family protein [Bacillus dakarensis]